jgi:hypothetical protein
MRRLQFGYVLTTSNGLLFAGDFAGWPAPPRALEIRTMDGIGAWLHETLYKMGAYIDPSMSATLLRFLAEEQARLGTGRERITRVLAIIEGVMENGPMNQETLGGSLSALANIPEAQRLVEWSTVVASAHCAVAST